jgi:hypothetical protein
LRAPVFQEPALCVVHRLLGEVDVAVPGGQASTTAYDSWNTASIADLWSIGLIGVKSRRRRHH